MPENLLTKIEVASILNVSPRTIDRMVADGLLPHVEIPGGQRPAYRLRRDDVEQAIRTWARGADNGLQ